MQDKQIQTHEALRLCVKARQTDRSEMTMMNGYVRILGQGESLLSCILNGELARIPHQGYYLLPGDRILIPLFDESYILVGALSDGSAGTVCSEFRLLVGNESLRGA